MAKYDEVLQTLDITKELYKQIVGIAHDAVKQQKKLARKEAIERMQQDIAKVSNKFFNNENLITLIIYGHFVKYIFLLIYHR